MVVNLKVVEQFMRTSCTRGYFSSNRHALSSQKSWPANSNKLYNFKKIQKIFVPTPGSTLEKGNNWQCRWIGFAYPYLFIRQYSWINVYKITHWTDLDILFWEECYWFWWTFFFWVGGRGEKVVKLEYKKSFSKCFSHVYLKGTALYSYGIWGLSTNGVEDYSPPLPTPSSFDNLPVGRLKSNYSNKIYLFVTENDEVKEIFNV